MRSITTLLSISKLTRCIPTAGSVKTKSGLQKDPRHTERRRVRHRDGSLLRAGMGLTTGLGWSDSEDEDAPSALTRRLISTTIERKRSTTIGGGGPSPPPGCGPFFSPPSAYEHHETHAPRHSSPFPGRSGSPLSKMALPTRKTSSIGGLRSTSASFPASVSPVIAKKEVPVPVPRTFSHTRNDSSNSDSPRSGITPTPPASSSSPASSVATPPFSSQDDVQSDLPRQHVDSTASDASTSTSRVPRSRASSYSASIYSTSTVNPLGSPPINNVVLPTTRTRKDSSPSVSTALSNGSSSRTDPSTPVAEDVPGSRRRAGSGGSATSRSTSRSKGRNRAGSSASSGTPPSTYRIPRSLSKMQSLDTIESTLENRVSVASSASSYSHQSAQGGGGSSSSGSSHSTVPRPLMLPQTLGAGNSLVRSFSQESNSVYSSTGSIGEAGFPARPTQFSNPRSYANYPSSPPLQSSISSPPLSSGTEFSLLSSGGSSRPTSPGSSPRPRPPVSPVGARPRPRTGTGMAYRTSSGVEYRTSSYGFGATSFVGDPSARLRSLSLAAAAVRESGVALGRNTNGVHAARPVVNVAVVGLVSGRGPTSAGGSRPSPSGMVDGKF